MLVVIHLVDELAQMRGSRAAPLLPHDLLERARARVVADRVNRQVTSRYYQVLVRTDAQEQRGLRRAARRAARVHRRAGWRFLGRRLDRPGRLRSASVRVAALRHRALPRARVCGARGGEGGLWEKYGAWLGG